MKTVSQTTSGELTEVAEGPFSGPRFSSPGPISPVSSLESYSGQQSFFRRKRVLWLHLSFWAVYLSFFLYRISYFQREGEFGWGSILLLAGIQMFFTLMIAYANYFYLLPRFLENKNIGRYLVEFFLPFALLMFLRIHAERYFIDAYSGQMAHLYTTRFVVQVVLGTFFIVLFVAMIRFAVDWFAFESKKKEVENEKLAAELNFLKAQINPHFLFNTLNNLYFLAYSQSPNTTEVIEKLSKMMRYMIYESNHAQVPLSKEIEYMQNYISLERLRLNNEIPVCFEVKGNPDQVMIVPLILITFLENAFKHGVSANNPGAWVKIKIQTTDEGLVYTVENSKLPFNAEPLEKSGIGLQNVRRRLDLIYPGRYRLEVENHPDRYAVLLNLRLT
jgi:two-component system, LytTR family, sensor histidine kinase AlgZ